MAHPPLQGHLQRVGALLIVPSFAIAGCTHGARFDAHADRPTCVVLSVGEAHGIAHLGALRAIGEQGIEVGCVTGASMGALIGGLYASAPTEDPVERYRRFAGLYVETTAQERKDGGLLGALLFGAAVAASGGAALAVAGAAAGGSLAGSGGVELVDLERFAQAYDQLLDSALIEDLPIPYASFFVSVTKESTAVQTVRRGPISEAVKRSIANPLLFRRFDPSVAGYVDPGVDRMAASPARDTCASFPRAQLLIINVTDQPTVLEGVKCPALEVRVPTSLHSEERQAILMGQGLTFERLVRAGYEATKAALR